MLDWRVARGEIQGWQYEALRLVLGPKSVYVPDFLLDMGAGYQPQIHEIKGYRRALGMSKLRIAARQFPVFMFYLVEKDAHGWNYEEIRAHD